jgi:nucleotide-binding universal stress UspA family protein
MLSTILVPLDGSPLAEFALPYAERIATTASARLILTRLIPPFILQRPEDDLAAADEARSYLEPLAGRLHAAGLVAETCAPWGSPPWRSWTRSVRVASISW